MGRSSLGILVGPKGRGTNLKAIVDACIGEGYPAEVKVVVAPSDTIPAAEIARNHQIDLAVIPSGGKDGNEDYGNHLLRSLEGCDLICLAGYMRLLPDVVLAAHPGRVINIHPALLPKFGGKGMYGIRVHEAVVASRELETGCTVHFVTDEYDEGAPILQMRCPVYPSDTSQDVADRVLELEKIAFPAAILKVLNGDAS